jgi:hypothetical protein
VALGTPARFGLESINNEFVVEDFQLKLIRGQRSRERKEK